MSVIFRFPGSLCLGGFLAFSAAVFGQTVTPQGGEFSILGGLPGDQVWPSISLSPTGGVVAWQDTVIDKNGGGLGAAILDNSFVAGRTARVNNTTLGNHFRPQAQLLPGDKTVIVWESTAAGTQADILARFSKNTAKKPVVPYGTNFYTGDVIVNTYTKGQQSDPSVAALPDGSVIIVWTSFGEDGSMGGVYGRRYKSTGVAATAKEFRVNQFTPYNQRNPSVVALPNGNYVVAWISEQERSATSVDVYARIYTDAGVALTDELPVNSGSAPCNTPTVAPLGDGGFSVVWSQKDMVVATNGWDIWGRAFTSEGMPLAPDYRINTYLYGDQYQPKIAAGPSGSLVVWTSLNQDGSREGVLAVFWPAAPRCPGRSFESIRPRSASRCILRWRGTGWGVFWWCGRVLRAGRGLICLVRCMWRINDPERGRNYFMATFILRLLKRSWAPALVCAAVQSASAFSIFGPAESWQVPTLDYVTRFYYGSTELGGPKNFGEGSRINTPIVTYGYDITFLTYFGAKGVAAIDSAMAVLNALPASSAANPEST